MRNKITTWMLSGLVAGCSMTTARTTPARDVPLVVAMGRFFEVGAAVPIRELNSAEQRLLFRHFGSVTPEDSMKSQFVQPREGRFDFTRADAIVDMAHRGGLAVHGHTLVWHSQCPDWFFMNGGQPASRELVLKRLRKHISTTVGHYAGRVNSWDVVNEAIDDGNAYLRESKWMTALGEDFIAESFVAARRADPAAELYYNDYGIEKPSKRAKTLRLIRSLRERQVPLDGIGIQGHWRLDHIPFKDIEDAIVAFHAEGLKVTISELDVDMVAPAHGGGPPHANNLSREAQQRLADQYAQLFALFIKHHDKISRVTLWGLHDGNSWLNKWPRKRTNHPLLWDRALQPKPALSAVIHQARAAHASRKTKPALKPKGKPS